METFVHKIYGAIRSQKDIDTDMKSIQINHEILQKTMVFSGMSPDSRLVEFIELPKNKYFVERKHIQSSSHRY